MFQSSSPSPSTRAERDILESLRKRPVRKAADLASPFNLSRMTVFRVLSKHKAYRSFNHNSAFCTLACTPRFDDDGLWFYRSIGFSRNGNLTDTLLALVNDSPAGHTSTELEGKLRTRVCNQLSALVRQGRLATARAGRSVVFLAAASQRQQQQLAQRSRLEPLDDAATAEPAPRTVLPVLLEVIRHPGVSLPTLASHLERRGSPTSLELIESIFDRYGLEKKGAL